MEKAITPSSSPGARGIRLRGHDYLFSHAQHVYRGSSLIIDRIVRRTNRERMDRLK